MAVIDFSQKRSEKHFDERTNFVAKKLQDELDVYLRKEEIAKGSKLTLDEIHLLNASFFLSVICNTEVKIEFLMRTIADVNKVLQDHLGSISHEKKEPCNDEAENTEK